MFITTLFFYNGSLGGSCTKTLRVLYLINAIIDPVTPATPLSRQPQGNAPNFLDSTHSGEPATACTTANYILLIHLIKRHLTGILLEMNHYPPLYLYSDSFLSVRMLSDSYEKRWNFLANEHEAGPLLDLRHIRGIYRVLLECPQQIWAP